MVLALTLWSPVALAVVDGRSDAARGLVWYAVAVVVAKFAVGGFDRLVRGYRAGGTDLLERTRDEQDDSSTRAQNGQTTDIDEEVRRRRLSDVTRTAT
jgi:hypothetical protein